MRIDRELISETYNIIYIYNMRQIKIIGALGKKQSLETFDHIKCGTDSLYRVVCFTSCSPL
jgi:hypothetical protein